MIEDPATNTIENSATNMNADLSTLEALLKKADGLKARIHKSKNIFADAEARENEKEIREIYKSILLQDLDFALKHNVEEHLWRSGFKVSIDLGRKNNTQGFLVWSSYGRSPSVSQIVLIKCLRDAADFYKNLLLEICSTYDFILPFLSDIIKVFESSTQGRKFLKKPGKRSCILISQNCLTHVGDCLRYEMEYDRARVFFKKALRLNPLSGHTHNQFGLLNSYEGNLLPTLYHYVRAIASPEPYLKARDNMTVNLNEKAEGNMGRYGETSIPIMHISTFTMYGHVFLLLMGCLRVGSTPTPVLGNLVKRLVSSLEAFAMNEIRGGNKMSSDSLNQMFAMSVFVFQDARNGFPPREGIHIFESHPKVTKAVVLNLIAGTLESLLQPLTEVSMEKILCYEGLPTIKLTLDWIRMEPCVRNAFKSRPRIWFRLNEVLNTLESAQNYFKGKEEKLCSIPLPEDRQLEGFTVLQPVLSEFRFFNDIFEEEPQVYSEPSILRLLRAHRLLKMRTWLIQNLNLSNELSVERRNASIELNRGTSSVLDLIASMDLNNGPHLDSEKSIKPSGKSCRKRTGRARKRNRKH